MTNRGARLKVIIRQVRVRRGRRWSREWRVQVCRRGRLLVWSEHYQRLRDAVRMVQNLQRSFAAGRVEMQRVPDRR